MKGENAGITIINKAGDEVSITINKDGNILMYLLLLYHLLQ